MYPIALHLQGKKCIVFGAGKVAQRRVWGLLESGAEAGRGGADEAEMRKSPWQHRSLCRRAGKTQS